MSNVLTRMFAFTAIVAYLIIGIGFVRLESEIDVTFSKLNSLSMLVSTSSIDVLAPEHIQEPLFSPIPINKPSVKPIAKRYAVPFRAFKRYTLPFGEVVKERPVYSESTFPKMVDLMDKIWDVGQQREIKDEIKVVQASNLKDAREVEEKALKIEKNEKSPIVERSNEKVESIAKNESIPDEVKIEELIAYDYSPKEIKKPLPENKVTQTTNLGSVLDSQIKKSPEIETIKASLKKKLKKGQAPGEPLALVAMKDKEKSNQINVSIHAVATDLITSHDVKGFEIQFLDDEKDNDQDFESGSIIYKDNISTDRMSRSVRLIKAGYSPTKADLVMERGLDSVSYPLIKEEKVEELLSPLKDRGSVGIVIVRLEEGQDVNIDTPYSQTMNLDENLVETTDSDIAFKMFVGVGSGNALVKFKKGNDSQFHKIIRVNENEITYEEFLEEEIKDEKIAVYEEDVLAKEKYPLIIASDDIKHFAKATPVQKINGNTYVAGFGKSAMASRRYLEFNHLKEPVFVGVRDGAEINLPSEDLIRYMMSQFEPAELQNSCIVQVNLKKKISFLEAMIDFENEKEIPKMIYLDKDGKFYDSPSVKTTKVVILGQRKSYTDKSQDYKINLKIQYEDETNQYIGTYCSPQTYLVEQL